MTGEGGPDTPSLILALGIQAASLRRMTVVGGRVERIDGAALVILGPRVLTDTDDVLASRPTGLAPQIGSAR